MTRAYDRSLFRLSIIALCLAVLSLLAIGCAGPSDKARRAHLVERGRDGVTASREGDQARAAAAFAEMWRDATEPDGGPAHSGGTFVLAQHRELRDAFRSEAGRPIAAELFEELRARVDRPEPHRAEVAGAVRLAAILGEQSAIADLVEQRRARGWARKPLRPARHMLASSGRPDLAKWLKPTAADSAVEGIGEGIRTAGLIAATAPVSLPMMLIATSGPLDFPVEDCAWTDPILPEDL